MFRRSRLGFVFGGGFGVSLVVCRRRRCAIAIIGLRFFLRDTRRFFNGRSRQVARNSWRHGPEEPA